MVKTTYIFIVLILLESPFLLCPLELYPKPQNSGSIKEIKLWELLVFKLFLKAQACLATQWILFQQVSAHLESETSTPILNSMLLK